MLEAGYKKGYTPVLKDISSTLVNFALSSGITSLEGRFPFNHPLISFLAEENEVERGETDESDTMMMRITNPEDLFKKIVPELEDRIKNFPWEGMVKISSERGDVSLKIKEGKIGISKELRELSLAKSVFMPSSTVE